MSMRAPRPMQRGMALITAMFVLVIVGLLTVSMYRSFGQQARISGNTLEKQRSLQAADSALQYAEWWIQQGSAGTGAACTANFNANVVAQMKACVTPLSATAAASLPWPVSGTYKPPSMVVAAGGGQATLSSSSGVDSAFAGVEKDINYTVSPSLYIAYLGLGADGRSLMYQVTGAGYGGNSSTASVVQSVFSMSSRITDVGQP